MIVVGSCYFLLTLLTPYDQNIDFCFPVMFHDHTNVVNTFDIVVIKAKSSSFDREGGRERGREINWILSVMALQYKGNELL